MLDLFIFLATILGFTFLFLGKAWMQDWPYYAATMFFLICGAGILTGGWETYSNGTVLIQDVNSGASIINFSTILYPGTFEANPTLFAMGTLFVGLALVCVFLGLREAGANRALKE